MATNNTDLYNFAAELIKFPLARRLIEDAGGYVISTGLVWPLDTVDGEKVFYYVNVIDREFRFLPDFSADLSTAEIVTDQDEILFVIGSIQAYMRTMVQLYLSQVSEVRFTEGNSPNIRIYPNNAILVWSFSLS
jgi:hypothetical protein